MYSGDFRRENELSKTNDFELADFLDEVLRYNTGVSSHEEDKQAGIDEDSWWTHDVQLWFFAHQYGMDDLVSIIHEKLHGGSQKGDDEMVLWEV